MHEALHTELRSLGLLPLGTEPPCCKDALAGLSRQEGPRERGPRGRVALLAILAPGKFSAECVHVSDLTRGAKPGQPTESQEIIHRC